MVVRQIGPLLGVVTLLMAGQLRAQGTHTVELRADRAESRFGFRPLEVSARPGDVIVFRVVSGPPHSIAFDPTGLERAQVAALNRAMVGRVSDLRGPLLVDVGDTYRILVPRLAPGTYRFYCLTHQVYGATGSLVIK
jgi:plastocyanin